MVPYRKTVYEATKTSAVSLYVSTSLLSLLTIAHQRLSTNSFRGTTYFMALSAVHPSLPSLRRHLLLAKTCEGRWLPSGVAARLQSSPMPHRKP